jgi:IS30 family transposase
VRAVAQALGRSVTAVNDDINANGGREKYDAERAQERHDRKRKNAKVQCLKVALDADLKEYVTKKIEAKWSPEIIAGRLKTHDTHLAYASMKAIYKFVASVHGRKIEKYLYHNRHKRKGGPKRGARKMKLDGRHMISERPAEANDRSVFGHFEGDFIESGRDGSGSILHLVERKTRYPFLALIGKKTIPIVNALAHDLIAKHEPKSLTLDNDIMFVRHAELSDLIGAPVYFCEPYHSWEKGTVENRNRFVREDIPKGTDLSTVDTKNLSAIEYDMRNRPMKVLNYKTPQEAWGVEMENRKQQKVAVEKSMTAVQKVAEKKRDAKLDVLSTFMKNGCTG